MADYDWGSAEQQLKQKAGQYYDSSMLDDLKRNVSYGAGDSVDPNSVNDWINRIANKAQLRGSNETNSTYQANGQGGVTVGPTGNVNSGSNNNTASQWNSGSTQSGPPDWYKAYLDKSLADQQAAAAAQKQKADALYGQLSDRASQSLNIDPNDPIIRAQTDAFSADQERARRNYLADQAESGGPMQNMEGLARVAAEKAGQATAGFRAQLLGNELQARRAEIADALNSMRGILTADQQANLTQQLALLDQGIKQQSLNLQDKGLGLDWQRALLQNNQAMGQLGLSAEQQASYWDAVRRGLL